MIQKLTRKFKTCRSRHGCNWLCSAILSWNWESQMANSIGNNIREYVGLVVVMLPCSSIVLSALSAPMVRMVQSMYVHLCRAPVDHT